MSIKNINCKCIGGYPRTNVQDIQSDLNTLFIWGCDGIPVLDTMYPVCLRYVCYIFGNKYIGIIIPNTGIPISMYKQILALSTNSRICHWHMIMQSHRSCMLIEELGIVIPSQGRYLHLGLLSLPIVLISRIRYIIDCPMKASHNISTTRMLLFELNTVRSLS
jgi:hypothetical protein